MSVLAAKFANVLFQIKRIWEIFTHLKLCVAVASQNFKWVGGIEIN